MDVMNRIKGALTEQPQHDFSVRVWDQANADWRKQAAKRERYYSVSLFSRNAWDNLNNAALLFGSPTAAILLLMRSAPLLSASFVNVVAPIGIIIGAGWLAGNRRMSPAAKVAITLTLIASTQTALEIKGGGPIETSSKSLELVDRA